MGTTWNPSDINANITLSNGNLTATGLNASNGGARGTTGKNTGKWFIRWDNVDLQGAGDNLDYVGLGSLADTLGLASGGQANQCICIQTGVAYSPGTGGQNMFAGLTGNTNTLELAIDFGGGKFWWRLNTSGNWNGTFGGATANPATGVNGLTLGTISALLYPYCRLTTTTSRATVNPTPASPPAGFATWDGTVIFTPSQCASLS